MTDQIDVLERLRNAERDPYSCIRHPDQRTFLAGDAADEIERLRGDLDKLRGEHARKRLLLMSAELERDELRADRDSWRSQAEDRVVDWDAMRAERDELRARIAAAPLAIMDTREGLGVCAPTEDDFPALYALQGKRVRLVAEDEG